MFEIILSSISALLLLVLAVYTLVKQRNVTGIMFSLSVLLLAAIEITDQAALHMANDPFAMKKIVLHLESFLPTMLLFFSLTYARRVSQKSISTLWWTLLGVSIILPLSTFLLPEGSFFYSPDLRIEKMLFLGNAGYWSYMGCVVYCIMALMNIEATYSAASVNEKWRIKFEVIGLGSILAVLIFYFSQGLLYRSINMNLIPIRSGVIIIALVLIGYSRIFRGNNIRISVSSYILYRSLTLLAVGSYLLVLGLIGEGLRYFDVAFSRDLTIFIAFVTGIGILIILLSGRIRRMAVVLLRKHFYAQKHDYRNEWLKFAERLTSCKRIEDVFNAILTTYRETFGLRGVSVYLFDKKTKVYKRIMNHNMSGGEMTLQISPGLIAYFVERIRVFNPSDEEYIPNAEEAAFIMKTGAKLLVPLVGNGGLSGFIVLGDQIVPEKLIYEDFDLMKTLARQASLSIFNFQLSEELAETREIAAVSRISSFVMHDLKNLASNLSLLLDNAENYLGDPEFQHDMIDTIKGTLNKMKVLIQRLKTVPEKRRLNVELVDIHLLTKEVIEEIAKMRQSANVIYQGSSVVASVDKEEIKKVVLNLVLNAFEAIKEGGAIRVRIGMDGENSYLEVGDDGCGMEREFVENDLFKPFHTTKEKGLGIGLYQCKQIVDAHSGRIDVVSEVGKGTVFTVYLPAVEQPQYAR
jgi:putative PEP-CTERM system histidine kinase